MSKQRAPRNRTITLTAAEQASYQTHLLTLQEGCQAAQLRNQIILADLFNILDFLPAQFVDLLFIDPPYNLNKVFNQQTFAQMSHADYQTWLDSWLSKLVRTLKPTASVYLCGTWQSAAAMQQVMAQHFILRNRITWEREKGRGAKTNWKNSSEDIWFGTMSNDYTFNVTAVKLKRRVMAPYTTAEGKPKDWDDTKQGRFRLTHPSNLWTDLTVPFWSMPENTDHPTQKPEKLLAKIILASSNPGDLVFDPFLGSGTTAVVAKKLERAYCGVEIDPLYACLAQKRLTLAEINKDIQGYEDGVFWERNTTLK